ITLLPSPTPFPYTTLFRSLTPLGTRYVVYSTDSLARARAATGRAVAELPPAVRAAYLVLPRSLSPRVAALAQQLTAGKATAPARSEEHTSELQSRENLVCR